MAEKDLANIEASRNTQQQMSYYDQLIDFCETSGQSPFTVSRSFAAYAPRQVITSFLERYEIFKLVQDVPGDIFECGVGSGQGLMAFAHFCAIHEPFCYTRRVVGFDTFAGFQGISDKDRTSNAKHMQEGGLCFDSHDMLQRAIQLFDMNRPIGHIPKVELVKGNISESLPVYLQEHPATVVGLLYLDMDLYQATFDTLTLLRGRMAKGAVICFDELNHRDYPGETLAVMETLGLPNLRLRRLPISANMCYAVVGE